MIGFGWKLLICASVNADGVSEMFITIETVSFCSMSGRGDSERESGLQFSSPVDVPLR
jgi:hypothetical protein